MELNKNYFPPDSWAMEARKDFVRVSIALKTLKALHAIRILQDLGFEGKIKVKPIKKKQ